MKTLQNNFTTPEQSKRLLELGVPAWTADCYYYEEGGISKDCTPNIVSLGEVWTDESKETMFSSFVDVPCWSVGRLIEIELICRATKEGMIPRLSFVYGELSENGLNSEYLIENLVTYLEVGQYNYDFSKLEE